MSLADEKLEEILDPSLAVTRARNRYLQRGYTSEWIDLRIKTAGVRNKELLEWQNRGANSDEDVAKLTDTLSKETFGKTVNEYKDFKGIGEEASLRDNMSPLELAVTNFADQVAIEMHKKRDSQGMDELSRDAVDAGRTGRFAREQAEQALEAPVMTSKNAIDFINNRKELK